MSKHSFVYSVIEEFVKIDEESLKQINKIKLTKDKHVSDMNLTSYYNENLSLNNFVPGTLVIFPGFIPHEVRPNKSNNRLIVSGNVI